MHEVFIQWLEGCGCAAVQPRHGIVRLYKTPLAPLMDGLPGQSWVWSCIFTISRSGKTFVHAALTAPPQGSLKLLLDKARELGASELVWDRVEKYGVRAVRFAL